MKKKSITTINNKRIQKNLDIKGLAPTTYDLANQMIDQISSELHDYYVNERRMYNYSPRLVKMIKLIEGSKAIVSEQQNVTLISQVYNIFDFKADLSELCDSHSC